MILRLSLDEVMSIRRNIVNTSIANHDAFGCVDPLNMGKLESGVYRQSTSSGGEYKYKTVHEIAANLFYGIAMAHAFENGNKRTAMISMLVFIDKNRYLLVDTTEEDLFTMALEIADHKFEIPKKQKINAQSECKALSKWIKLRIRERVLGEKVTHIKELKQKLLDLGCTFDPPHKNFMKIRRKNYSYKIGYPRDNFDVAVPTIKSIRKNLRLDEIHGTDSATFYELDSKVTDFVNRYRNLMKRLAES